MSGSLLIRLGLVGVGVVRSLDPAALLERRSGADEGDEVGTFTAHQRAWADSMSLKAFATPAAREPGPLVTR